MTPYQIRSTAQLGLRAISIAAKAFLVGYGAYQQLSDLNRSMKKLGAQSPTKETKPQEIRAVNE